MRNQSDVAAELRIAKVRQRHPIHRDPPGLGLIEAQQQAQPYGPHVLSERSVRLKGGSANVLRSGPGDAYAIVGVLGGR